MCSAPHAVYTLLAAFVRQDQFDYYPSPDPFADLGPDLQLQRDPQPESQADELGGIRTSGSYVKGSHNILKGGVTFEQTGLTENDGFGIVDPGLLERLGLFECRRITGHQPAPYKPCELRGSAYAERGSGNGRGI